MLYIIWGLYVLCNIAFYMLTRSCISWGILDDPDMQKNLEILRKDLEHMDDVEIIKKSAMIGFNMFALPVAIFLSFAVLYFQGG